MQLKINDFLINIIFNKNDVPDKIPILFLHGFAGSSDDWKFLFNDIHSKFTPILIDLLGHGDSDSPRDPRFYEVDFQCNLIRELFIRLSLEKVVLIGYSMGGRLALSYTLRFPENVSGLILESTSFGIQAENEKIERINSDISLAEKIGSGNLEVFFNEWFNNPLFSSLHNLPTERFNALKKSRVNKNNVIGLKNSLIGFSTGKMEYFIPQISKLSFKVLLIAGEYDTKFQDFAQIAKEHFPNSELKVISKTGHNVHFEKPKEFLKLINDFLNNI